MEKKKIKIKVYRPKEYRLLSGANSAVKSINEKLVPALSGIGFDLTSENLKDCLSNGARTIHDSYIGEINRDCARVSLPASKKMLEDAALAEYSKFKSVLTEVLKEITPDAPKYISVAGNKAIVPDGARAAITEDCTQYITTDAEIARYDKYLAAIEAMNALFDGNVISGWEEMFAPSGGKFLPQPLDYGYLNQRINQSKTN